MIEFEQKVTSLLMASNDVPSNETYFLIRHRFQFLSLGVPKILKIERIQKRKIPLSISLGTANEGFSSLCLKSFTS